MSIAAGIYFFPKDWEHCKATTCPSFPAIIRLRRVVNGHTEEGASQNYARGASMNIAHFADR
jgi:hypothetical protein